MPREHSRALGILAACLLAFAVSVWPTVAHPLLFSNDGPQHLLQGFVHGHYTDPRYGFDSVVALNEPLTSRGYLDLFRWLEPSLGWRRAHLAILVIAEALWCSAWAALALRLHRHRWPFAVLGCATGIQWAYWIGLLPFFLGLGAALWTIHLVLVRPTPLHYVALGAALLVCGQLHPLPVVLVGVALLGLALTRGVRDTILTILAGLPSVALCQYISLHSIHAEARLQWDNPIDPIRALVAQFFCGHEAVGALVLALLLFACFYAWRRRSGPSVAFGVVGVAFVAAAYFAPNEMRGWQMFGPRFLPLGYALVFCAAPLEQLSGRGRAVLGVAVASIVGGHAAWAEDFHAQLERDSAPILELARQLPSQAGHDWGMVVTCGDAEGLEGFDYDSDGPANLNAWLHLAQVLALDLGGRPLFSQASDPLMHAMLAPRVRLARAALPGGDWAHGWPALDDLQRRESVNAILDGIRMTTSYVVFVGFAGDERLVEEAGYEITARVSDGTRTAVAARFRGCDVSIVVPVDAVLVESGVMPSTVGDSTRVPDVEGLVEFRRSGCGSRWIRVDGTPCGGSEFDPARRARAFFSDGAVLVCEPSR